MLNITPGIHQTERIKKEKSSIGAAVILGILAMCLLFSFFAFLLAILALFR